MAVQRRVGGLPLAMYAARCCWFRSWQSEYSAFAVSAATIGRPTVPQRWRGRRRSMWPRRLLCLRRGQLPSLPEAAFSEPVVVIADVGLADARAVADGASAHIAYLGASELQQGQTDSIGIGVDDWASAARARHRTTAGELQTEPLDIGGPSDIGKVTDALNDVANTFSTVEVRTS